VSETPTGTCISASILLFFFFLTALISLQRGKGNSYRRLLITLLSSISVTAVVGICFRIQTSLPLSVLLACVCTIAVALFLEFVAYRPLAGSARLNYLISAIGMSLAFQGVMQILFGTERRRFPESVVESLSFLDGSLESLGIREIVSGVDALIVITSIAAMIVVFVVVQRTRVGLVVRAVADDAQLARQFGVDVTLAHIAAFAIGALLACLASILFVARENALEPTFGYHQGLLAFAAAVLGGIGRIDGAFVGGLVIGIVLSFAPLIPIDVLAAALLGESVSSLPSFRASDWSYGVVYITMIFILILRPKGLLGEKRHRIV